MVGLHLQDPLQGAQFAQEGQGDRRLPRNVRALWLGEVKSQSIYQHQHNPGESGSHPAGPGLPLAPPWQRPRAWGLLAAAMVGELQTGEQETTGEEGNASVEEEADPGQEEQHRDLLHPSGGGRAENASLWGKEPLGVLVPQCKPS